MGWTLYPNINNVVAFNFSSKFNGYIQEMKPTILQVSKLKLAKVQKILLFQLKHNDLLVVCAVEVLMKLCV